MGAHRSLGLGSIPRHNSFEDSTMFLRSLSASSIGGERGGPQERQRVMQGQKALSQKAIMRCCKYCCMNCAVLSLLLKWVIRKGCLNGQFRFQGC
jgi:hypothetical protein